VGEGSGMEGRDGEGNEKRFSLGDSLIGRWCDVVHLE